MKLRLVPDGDRDKLPSDPTKLALWYFDNNKNMWIQEKASSDFSFIDPSSVPRSGWWNCDYPINVSTFFGTLQWADDFTGVVNATVESEGLNYAGRTTSRSDTTGHFEIRVKENSDVALLVLTGTQTYVVGKVTTPRSGQRRGLDIIYIPRLDPKRQIKLARFDVGAQNPNLNFFYGRQEKLQQEVLDFLKKVSHWSQWMTWQVEK